MVPGAPEDALDLIKACLCLRPSARLSAEEALEHPFVKEFHDRGSHRETKCVRKMVLPINDNVKKEVKEYVKQLNAMCYKKNAEIKQERRLAMYFD